MSGERFTSQPWTHVDRKKGMDTNCWPGPEAGSQGAYRSWRVIHTGSKTRLDIQYGGGDVVYQNTCIACAWLWVLSPMGKTGASTRAVKATEQRTWRHQLLSLPTTLGQVSWHC